MGYILSNGVKYGKPNMAALEGDWGRKIIERIMSTPRLDRDALHRMNEPIREQLREARSRNEA